MNSIMSRQDDDAVIKCLCMIIRSHMIKSLESNTELYPEFEVFRDDKQVHSSSFSSYADSKDTYEDACRKVPTLETITNYFNHIFKKSLMESECIIITLIYIERLFVATNGKSWLYM